MSVVSANTTEQQPKPSYLTMLDQQRDSPQWKHYRGYWDIYRSMVKCTAPDSDLVKRAIKDLHEAVLKRYPNSSPEDMAGTAYEGICNDVLGLAAGFLSTDIRQQRLLDFLGGFKTKAGQQDSQDFTIWRNEHDLSVHVRDQLDQKQIYTTPGPADAGADNEETAQIHINLSAFIAKLIGAGLLPMSDTIDCPMYELLNGLEPSGAKGNEGTVLELWRTACTVSAIEYIFHAGPQILAAIKENNHPNIAWLKGRQKWKIWGTRLAELATAASDHAPWFIKTNAQKAHEIMVSLAPEDFKDSDYDGIDHSKFEETKSEAQGPIDGQSIRTDVSGDKTAGLIETVDS